MEFEPAVKAIRQTYKVLSGKSEAEVILTYKGTEYGVTQPWHIKVENREARHETHIGAANMLLEILKKELNDKVLSAEREAVALRKALNGLGN